MSPNDFSIVKVYKRLKEEGGIELANAVQDLDIQQLVEDGNMQTKLERNCLQGLEKSWMPSMVMTWRKCCAIFLLALCRSLCGLDE